MAPWTWGWSSWPPPLASGVGLLLLAAAPGLRLRGVGYLLPAAAPDLGRGQCKEIEENNRMGKTRDLFKKIRATKGTFHAKMGLIKDRNGMDLTEADLLRRDGKNTQKNCTKKIFTTKIIRMV